MEFFTLAHPLLPKGTTLPPDVDKMVGSPFSGRFTFRDQAVEDVVKGH
jgi:hypothetical protein